MVDKELATSIHISQKKAVRSVIKQYDLGQLSIDWIKDDLAHRDYDTLALSPSAQHEYPA